MELNPRPDQVSLWVSLLVLSRAAVMVNETYAGVIGEAQWFFSRWAFLKMNSGFGLSQKVPDLAPEVGIVMFVSTAAAAVTSLHGERPG